jgi:uncharacterized protein YkwD
MRATTTKFVSAALSIVIAIAIGASQPAAAQSDPSCDAEPRPRLALLCAVNAARADHGLPAFKSQKRLRTAARRHVADMIQRHYFSHERHGWTLPSRLRAARWNGDTAAEALAYGCAELAKPTAIVQAWLESPGHRAIVLGKYRLAGIGHKAVVPVGDCAPGATWVLVTGRR